MSISGIPNSFTPPGVYINVTINDSNSSSEVFNVLVLGQASPNSAYASKPDLYAVSSLSQLATDFGSDSDVYKIISAYRNIDISTSLYALNCVVAETTTTQTNGNIKQINTTLSTTAQATDMAGTNVVATGGSGTGATFDITSSKSTDGTSFTPASITINNIGSNYKVGDKLTINNVGTITVTGLDSEEVQVPADDNTVITTALKNAGNVEFDIITGAYNSAKALQALDTYFTGTWGYAEETYGHYITAYQSDVVNDLVQNAGTFNFKTSTVIAIPTDLDLYQSIGLAVSQIATTTQSNPSLPLRSFSLNSGVISVANRWDIATRNTLFNNGYSTVYADTAGNPTLERTRISATTEDGITINDTSLETIFQTVYCAKAVRSGLSPFILNRKIIMNDDDVVAPSTYVVTPNAIRGKCVSIYSNLVNELVATDIATFKKALNVVIDQDVNGRIDVYYPITLASGLNQIAINLSTQK